MMFNIWVFDDFTSMLFRAPELYIPDFSEPEPQDLSRANATQPLRRNQN